MRQTNLLLLLFLLAALAACVPVTPEITPAPFSGRSTSGVSPLAASADPTSTPALLATVTLATPPQPVPTQSGEQVYLDPEGWFSLAYPKEWTAKSESLYEGSDGFMEVGYIPEYAFVPQVLTVCEWLANSATQDIYTVSWLGTVGMGGCQLHSRPEVSPATTWAVAENPSADAAHRFFYVKADHAHFGRITNTFRWLRPVEEKKEPDFDQAEYPLEAVDFWNQTSSIPAHIVLKEYALPSKYQREDPSKKIFLDFVPSDLLPTPNLVHPSRSPETVEGVNQSLEKYGYQLRQLDNGYLYDLYQNDARVLQNIYQLPRIYLFQTGDGERLVTFAHTLIDPNQSPAREGNVISYLIQDENVSVWKQAVLNPMYSGWRAIWVEDEPLFLGLGEGVTLQILTAQHEKVFSFATYYVTQVPIKKFQAWDDHWVLEVSNFVIQDGEILNETYQFEEMFDWSLIHKKPFYFFRKGPQVGFSYDGQFFSNFYHEVIHGYCCGLALNNPRLRGNTLSFFGKRDEVWYYVVLEFLAS